MLAISDFTRQERGPRTFDVWSHATGVETSIGKFEVECIVDTSAQPGAEMLARLQPVLTFVLEHTDAILRAVYDEYLRACEDVEWMQELGLPMDLAPSDVVSLLSYRSVCVAHHLDDDPESESRGPYVHISPAWDEEHDLFLTVRDGAVERLEH